MRKYFNAAKRNYYARKMVRELRAMQVHRALGCAMFALSEWRLIRDNAR